MASGLKIMLAILLVLTFIPGFSQTFTFVDQPYLETSAKADTLVSADRIFLTIEISEKDTGNVSIEDLESKMTDQLKQLGIDLDNQLKLTDSYSNVKNSLLKKKVVLKSKAYSLLVYDTLTAHKAIKTLKEIKGSRVFPDKTEYSKTEELKQILKSIAVQKAKRNATLMAATLNQKIGSAIYISDLENVPNLQDNSPGEPTSNLKNGHETNEFEKIKVEIEVKVTFELQ